MGRLKNVLSRELEAMFTKCEVKILQSYFIYTATTLRNNISLKIMLTDNNQIFRNWFIIHSRLTEVSAQIIQCIIFERYELSMM